MRPFWPLLGAMMGGAWLGLAWFVFNSIAVGSPHKKAELAWAVLGLAGAIGLAFGVFWAAGAFQLDKQQVKLAVLVLTLWKITVYYAIYTLQMRSFDIYEYYGGKTKNGMLLVFLAIFLRGRVADGLTTFWALVLL